MLDDGEKLMATDVTHVLVGAEVIFPPAVSVSGSGSACERQGKGCARRLMTRSLLEPSDRIGSSIKNFFRASSQRCHARSSFEPRLESLSKNTPRVI